MAELHHGRVASKRVRLLAEWLGNPAGVVMNLWHQKADELIARGAAEVINGNGVEAKAPDAPPVNKMVEKPEVKKTARKRRKPIK